MNKLYWDISAFFVLSAICGALLGGGIMSGAADQAQEARKKTKRPERQMPAVVMEDR